MSFWLENEVIKMKKVSHHRHHQSHYEDEYYIKIERKNKKERMELL